MDSQGERQSIDGELDRLKCAYSESNKRLRELTNLPELSADEHDEALSLAQYMSLLNQQMRQLRIRVQHFRSNRIAHVNNQWFVTTREGVDVGPYPDRVAAEAAVARLTAILDGIHDSETAARFIRDESKRLQR